MYYDTVVTSSCTLVVTLYGSILMPSSVYIWFSSLVYTWSGIHLVRHSEGMCVDLG